MIHYTKIFLPCIYVSLKWKHSRLRSLLIAFLFSILEEKEKEMNRHVLSDGGKTDAIVLESHAGDDFLHSQACSSAVSMIDGEKAKGWEKGVSHLYTEK